MNVNAQNHQIAANIREHGWHCLYVFSNQEDEEPFSYSVGFEDSFGAPEIVVFGLDKEMAHSLLDECAHLLREGHRFAADVPNDSVLADDYQVVFKPLRAEYVGAYLGTAQRYYGLRPFRALVMFLHDMNHRFPWDEGYNGAAAEEALKLVTA